MQSPEIKDIQKCILEILRAIDKACRENGITYFLSDGTMLGAVRHKGFIPWDDDADICMPRPDYDKLIANVKNWLPDYYDVVTGLIDPEYPYPFARIYDKRTTYQPSKKYDHISGVPVDIFPIDGIIEDCKERQNHLAKYKRLAKRLYFSHRDLNRTKNFFDKFAHWIVKKMYNPKKIHEQIDSLMRKYDYNSSPLICKYFDYHYGVDKSIFPRKFFAAPVDIQFEDMIAMGIPEAHDYLTIWYDDYMQLPPVEKRAKPNFNICDLNTPCQEYINKMKK